MREDLTHNEKGFIAFQELKDSHNLRMIRRLQRLDLLLDLLLRVQLFNPALVHDLDCAGQLCDTVPAGVDLGKVAFV